MIDAQPIRPLADGTGAALGYLLRRAEQELIAAIRSIDPRASALHDEMASVYSARARMLMTTE